MMNKKQKILELEEEIKELKRMFITDEIERLRVIKKRYDAQTALLEKIRLEVDKVQTVLDQNTGIHTVTVTYKVPRQVVQFDSNNEPVVSGMFKSINALNLISYDDQERISKEIVNASSKNEG